MNLILTDGVEIKKIAGENLLLCREKAQGRLPDVTMINDEGVRLLTLFSDGCDSEKIIATSEKPDETREFIDSLKKLGYLVEEM